MEHKEFIIPIEDNEYFQGRIVVYQTYQGHNADIVITHKESGKIYTPVKQLFGFSDQEDLLRSSVQILSSFLLTAKTKS